MKLSDFDEIKFFSAEEVVATGANIASVQPSLLRALDELRAEIGRPIKLLRNGMTSGKHSAEEHAKGLAVDFAIKGLKKAHIPKLLIVAGAVGFRGLGVYRNGLGVYSFHADLRDNLALWGGTKRNNGDRWSYGGVTLELGRK